MSETIVAGVDGGGTRTRVALVDGAGELLGQGEAGPGNLQDVGEERLAEHVGAALTAAWSAVGRPRAPLAAAFLGIAGAESPDEHAAVRRAAERIELAPRVGVGHDLRVALAGGLRGAPGIVVIAGTGSSCYGRNAAGETWKSAGWGSALDDPGSAHDLGRSALAACLHAFDGRGAETVLSRSVWAALGLTDWRDLPRRLAARELDRAGVAALAPLVTRAAGEGDAVARAIVERGAGELADAVATVAARLAFETPAVVACGGLAGAPVYRASLDRAIAARVPDARVSDPLLPPVMGAALCALEELDR